jgi:hypothetical protein
MCKESVKLTAYNGTCHWIRCNTANFHIDCVTSCITCNPNSGITQIACNSSLDEWIVETICSGIIMHHSFEKWQNPKTIKCTRGLYVTISTHNFVNWKMQYKYIHGSICLALYSITWQKEQKIMMTYYCDTMNYVTVVSWSHNIRPLIIKVINYM